MWGFRSFPQCSSHWSRIHLGTFVIQSTKLCCPDLDHIYAFTEFSILQHYATAFSFFQFFALFRMAVPYQGAAENGIAPWLAPLSPVYFRVPRQYASKYYSDSRGDKRKETTKWEQNRTERGSEKCNFHENFLFSIINNTAEQSETATRIT